MIDKLALGTVQFGIDYGINNTTGIVPEKSVYSILKLCALNQIHVIDTAYAYGISEEILGLSDLTKFKVVSKLPPSTKSEVKSYCEKSLKRLSISTLYGYLLHNFSIYNTDKGVWEKMVELKAEGKTSKIGFSLYNPEELEQIFNDELSFDIIQIPYNIFDRRFESYFPELKSRNIEIHTRSAFLQGLFFKPIEELPKNFDSVKSKLSHLDVIIEDLEISKAQSCLGFALSNRYIDHVVVGIDNLDQLKSNIDEIKNIPSIDFNVFDELSVSEPSIINPALWEN